MFRLGQAGRWEGGTVAHVLSQDAGVVARPVASVNEPRSAGGVGAAVGWYVWPVAVVLGAAWPVMSSGLWSWVAVAACVSAGGVGLGGIWWSRRDQAKRLAQTLPGLHLGGFAWVAMALAVVALSAGSTAWRSWGRANIMWPAAVPSGRAQAEVRIDSLPSPLGFGGWQVEADVLDWPSAAGGMGQPSRRRDAHRAVNQVRGAQAIDAPSLARLAGVQRVRLYWPPGDAPVPGDTWRVDARWHRPDGVLNPAGFDAELQAWERGTGAVGQVDAQGLAHLSTARWWTPAGWWDRWRMALRDRIQAQVASRVEAGVLAGLTVGDQSAVDTGEWEVFRRTGVAHLISISGSHIAVVGWWVAWLVRRSWGRSHRLAHRWPAPQAALVAAVLACWSYALLSGWGVPAQRTVWTMAALCVLRLLGRVWPWPLTSLWVMAGVVLLDPWALLQPGFWLSFLCVMVLMTAGGETVPSVQPADVTGKPSWAHTSLRHMKATWRGAVQLARVQVILSVAMAPLALLCFHQVSVVGVVVNLAAVPLFDVVVTPLALLGAAWAPLWSLNAKVLSLTLKALAWAAAWPGATSVWPVPPTWLGLWAVGAGLLWCWPGPRGWRWGWALAMLPLLCLPPRWHLLPQPDQGQFTALAIDVGQGTAVWVRTHHHALLFDTGPKLGQADDAGRRHILPLLQALGETRLDTLVLSHEDTDHVGGAASVLAGMRVLRVVGSLPMGHPLRAAVPAPGAAQVPYTDCVAGQGWQWDGVRFEWLHPFQRGAAGDPNAHACVLRVQAAGPTGHAGLAAEPPASLLLTADIEAEQEAALLAAQAPLRATVLMAPHHGSATSSTAAFLAAVQPAQVVVQAGARNRYGHPAPDVTARYARLALPWAATPSCGAWWWASAEPLRAAQTAAPTLGDGAGATQGRLAVGHCWRQAHPKPWRAAPLGPDS